MARRPQGRETTRTYCCLQNSNPEFRVQGLGLVARRLQGYAKVWGLGV